MYHIFATTADYATTNPVVGWLPGGPNHHVVHHLCPFVCHTHYGPLTRIVKDTAEEFGGPLSATTTMTRAIWHLSDAPQATGQRKLIASVCSLIYGWTAWLETNYMKYLLPPRENAEGQQL